PLTVSSIARTAWDRPCCALSDYGGLTPFSYFSLARHTTWRQRAFFRYDRVRFAETSLNG
ncbi:MAG: hypothetical protein KDA60_22330, partial [Planctomycetales bacterium]|nr:hypothetical protein [Planctomycetales bacterium]